MDFFIDEDDEPATCKTKGVKKVGKKSPKKTLKTGRAIKAKKETPRLAMKKAICMKRPAAAPERKTKANKCKACSSGDLLKTDSELKRLFKKAGQPQTEPFTRAPKMGHELRLGSDCTGIGTDFLAMQLLGIPMTTFNLIWIFFEFCTR